MQPAIFLDRDGVIIENRPEYVRSWDDVFIFPQALTALAKARELPYKIVIITNQSTIGRGSVTKTVADEINRRLLAEIERTGGRIDGVFICPHRPEDECPCRKPKPGLLYQAAQELSLDLARSFLIGDALSDLQAGIAAGIHNIALVRTGRGEFQARIPDINTMNSFPIYENLLEAISAIDSSGFSKIS